MDGNLFGYRSQVNYFPNNDTTVSVLVNRGLTENDFKAELVIEAYNASIANRLNLSDDLAINGTEADDYLTGTSNNDITNGFEGNDIITGKKSPDAIDGGTRNDLLDGGKGKDYLFGKEGNDNLYGGRNDDFLNGGVGNDLLEGGKGSDFLIGSDRFVLSEKGTDTITDFTESEDLIELPETISFANLKIIQGQGDNTINTLTNFESETLAILNGIEAIEISLFDFAV